MVLKMNENEQKKHNYIRIMKEGKLMDEIEL